jgi:hypothetical protein
VKNKKIHKVTNTEITSSSLSLPLTWQVLVKNLYCILPVLARAAWGLYYADYAGFAENPCWKGGGALILKSGFSKSRMSQQICLSRPCKPIRCTKYALLRTFTQPIELFLCKKMESPLLKGKKYREMVFLIFQATILRITN